MRSPGGGGCGLPAPSAGQTVHWTGRIRPIQICEDTTIPPGATVQIDAGVEVEVLEGVTLSVAGADRARFDGPAGVGRRIRHAPC